MASTSFHGFLRISPVRKFIANSAVTLVLSGSIDAQIQQYRQLQQQQGKSQEQLEEQFESQSQDQSQEQAIPDEMMDSEEDQASQSDQLDGFQSASRPFLVDGPHSNRSLRRERLETQDAGASDFDKPRPSAPVWREREKTTEFQKFVQTSTGQMLPIYGSWLFNRVPSTYAPVDHIPVTPDYTVGPGDEIDIRVWGQINFNRREIVDRTGDIFIPQVGRIGLSGLHFAQLQDTIKSSISRVYKNFELNVNMGQLRSIQVLIVGYARRPGTYTVSSLATMVNAIFASGGPSNRGSMRSIQLKRSGKVIMTLDLYDLLLQGQKSDDCPLQPGDVIFIPAAGPRVAVAGSVENPAIYEVKPGTALHDVLDYAGGLSPVAAGQHAILQRINDRAALQVQDLTLSGSGLGAALQNGDIIHLLPLVPRFDKTVTLRGNVADPARFPWRVGMKISDLIPNKESLLTRDFWREHNRLSDVPTRPDNARRRPLEDGTVPSEDGAQSNRQLLPLQRVRMNDFRDYHDEAHDTSADTSLAAAQSGQKVLALRQFDPKNNVQPFAPDIDWNYAVIERLDTQSLATHLIPFNLGKVVLEHDASADIPLEPGDIVSVFSSADIAAPKAEQTKYVRLEGEVKMAGIYSVHPGETLRDLVARAGGLTPNAYLYGSQFTRESTRREQQKRYSEFLDHLETDINEGGSTLSTRIVSAQQAATAQASLTSQRTMLEKLRQTAATGRVVLALDPDSHDLNALPALPLENGDRLYVPSVPSTINVVGTVYNQSAFLYEPDHRLGYYLQCAGGPSRYADKGRLFVIRADGSIVSKDTRSHLFSSNFDSVRMYPGDTLVVPTNVTKTTALRGLMDWSQVISNFGIGAAAVNVLK
jgi:polysaccharide biosynthesis/export protein